MIKDLFEFPIILIDGDNEERKQHERERLALPEDDQGDYDIIEGKAEYPYYDFIGLEDRWVPTDESFQKSLNGKFEACTVKFANVPQLLVPWTRSKFKREMNKFTEERMKEKEDQSQQQEVAVMRIDADQLMTILKGDKKDDSKNQ